MRYFRRSSNRQSDTAELPADGSPSCAWRVVFYNYIPDGKPHAFDAEIRWKLVGHGVCRQSPRSGNCAVASQCYCRKTHSLMLVLSPARRLVAAAALVANCRRHIVNYRALYCVLKQSAYTSVGTIRPLNCWRQFDTPLWPMINWATTATISTQTAINSVNISVIIDYTNRRKQWLVQPGLAQSWHTILQLPN